jgi:hypothetical protein
MPRPRRYLEELIQRGVRLAIESGRPVAGYNRMLWTAMRRKAAYLPGLS